jgi:carboxyl-terminal processing protease
VQRYDDHESGVVWEGPLVLLTNRFTSGPAEIVAAAIQDYGRGLVVGDEATRGQGTTQTLQVLSEKLFPGLAERPDLGALRLTTQQTFRINGESIQQRGVAADVVLPSMSNAMDVSESELDHALPFDQIPAADYTRLGMANEELLSTLREESEKRRTGSSAFQELVESIATYRERKARSTVTLNEQNMIVERNDDPPDDEAINAEPLVPGIDGPHAYLEEVIQVALDYVETLGK